MLSRRFATMSALALALSGAGCGSLSGNTGSPSTLTNIHGTVTSDSASALPALATAIVWFGMSPDGTFHESADGVPVSGGFPASFDIALTTVPPASAMFDFSTVFGDGPDVGATGVHVALGFVVAYDDLNGNGRLDLVDPGASQYVDEIEGVADRLIVYADQTVPTPLATSPQFAALGIDGSTPQKGYNLVLPDSNYCYADAGAGSAGACVGGYIWEPMNTPVSLSLGKGSSVIAPQDLQELMCSTGPNGNTTFTSSTLPPTISVADFSGALPPADDRNVHCDDLDNFEYLSSCTTGPAAPCQQVTTVCTQQTIVTLDPVGGSPIAPPAGWPCGAQPPPSPIFLTWAAGQHSSSGGGGGIGGASGAGTPDAGLSSN